MSLETFIRNMPKVELDLLLEGSIRADTLQIIAEQNDIPFTSRQFKQWMDVFNHPDFQKMDSLLQTVANWLQQPEDLSRIVYELGVSLAKQNIHYAEIGFIPTLYTNMTFEQILAAINDGRSRVERGWNVRLAWILQLPRNQIRRVDEVVRWATSASARMNGIVGIGLIGRDDLPPVEDFERPFQNARKKGVGCSISAGDSRGSNGIIAAIHHLQPTRIVGGWGADKSDEASSLLSENSIGLVTHLSYALAMKQVHKAVDYPIIDLLKRNVPVIIGSAMPAYLNTSLTQEYLAFANTFSLNREVIETISINAIRCSLLDADEKSKLINNFQRDFQSLST